MATITLSNPTPNGDESMTDITPRTAKVDLAFDRKDRIKARMVEYLRQQVEQTMRLAGELTHYVERIEDHTEAVAADTLLSWAINATEQFGNRNLQRAMGLASDYAVAAEAARRAVED